MIPLFLRLNIIYFLINLIYARRHKHYFDTSNKLNELKNKTEEALKLLEGDSSSPLEQTFRTKEKVVIQVFYESLSPECKSFHKHILMPVVEKLNNNIRVMTYPFGNAQVLNHKGHVEFKCHHGPEECYGNKLHACTLALMGNRTQALVFNTCMMSLKGHTHGSDDHSADVCGKTYKMDTASIKECAKSTTGDELFKFFGDESTKVNYKTVPYVLINGRQCKGNNLMRNACAAFCKPPAACRKLH